MSRWVPDATTFQYDAHGNLVSDGRRTFGWDVENRLTSVTVAGQWQTEYEHDGLSRVRVAREDVERDDVRGGRGGAVRVRRAPVLEERDGNNAPLRTYTRTYPAPCPARAASEVWWR